MTCITMIADVVVVAAAVVAVAVVVVVEILIFFHPSIVHIGGVKLN